MKIAIQNFEENKLQDNNLSNPSLDQVATSIYIYMDCPRLTYYLQANGDVEQLPDDILVEDPAAATTTVITAVPPPA